MGTDSGAAPTFVNPNLDVVYSEAWIAVDEYTPAILEVPAVPPGRYYTAQIVDEWAEITHNINERNFPDHPHGRYAICLAGAHPTIPEGCLRVDIPSTKAKLLTRVAARRRRRRRRRPAAPVHPRLHRIPRREPPTRLPDFDNAPCPADGLSQQPTSTPPSPRRTRAEGRVAATARA